MFGVTCGSFGAIPDGTNLQRLCFDECLGTKVSCCKNGECLGDEFTKIECEEILGGLAFAGPCADVDCCDQNIKVGACCKDAACTQKTLTECNASGGVFMGAGEICESVNCACIGTPVPPVYGSCCYCLNNQVACKVTLEIDCETGLWQEDPKATSSSTCDFVCTPGSLDCSAPNSRCCYYNGTNTTCTVTTETNCDSAEGTWTVGGLDCVSFICDPCTSCNGGPCPDCITQVPGIACRCDTSECFDVVDTSVNGCPVGYTCHPSPAVCADNPCGCGSGDDCDSIRTDVEDGGNCPNISESVILTSNWQAVSCSQINNIKSTISNTNPTINVDTHAGLLVRDFYLDISSDPPDWNVDVTDDLNFCFSIDMVDHDSPIPGALNDDKLADQSIRVFLLRTWYPKNFAQNYAAYKGFHYKNFLDEIDLVTPATNTNSEDEIAIWNRLDELFIGSNNADNIEYSDILSTYVSKNGMQKIYHFENSVDFGNIDFRTDNLRKELNCPIYGINPRGNAPYIGNSTLQTIFNPLVNTSTIDNSYPTSAEYDSRKYYESVDIFLRYRLLSLVSGTWPDSMLYPPPDSESETVGFYSRIFRKLNTSAGLTFVTTTGVGKSNYLLHSQTIPTDGLNYTVNYGGNTTTTHRFSGYSDLGVSVVDGGVRSFASKDDIGVYLKHSSLNNFSNIGNHYSGLVQNFPVSNVGHPHTTAFEANYVDGGFLEPGTKLQYDDVSTRDDSPLHLTKQSAILFDSGVITRNGNTIRTISTPDPIDSAITNYIQIKVPRTQWTYTGAINDPSLVTPSFSKVSAKYFPNTVFTAGQAVQYSPTYHFCVNLKDYANTYMLDANGVNDTSEYLLYGDEHEAQTDPDTNVPSRKQFTQHVNKLRVLVYSYAHNPHMEGITYSSVDLLAGPTNTKSLEKLSSSFLDTIIQKEDTIKPSSYILRYHHIDAGSGLNVCDNPIGVGCDVCGERVLDYESNVYMIIPYDELCYYIRDLCKDQRAVSFFSGGLGTIEICSCNCVDPACAKTHHIVSSCGDDQDCSCKGERIAVPYSKCLGNPCRESDNISLRKSCGRDCRPGFYLDQGGFIWHFDDTLRIFIIKLKPIKNSSLFSVVPENILFDHLYDGPLGVYSRECICDGCAAPNQLPSTTLMSNILAAGFPGQCNLNKCIISNKTCNFGSVSSAEDLQKILINIATAPEEFTCSIWSILPDHIQNYVEINQGGSCSSGFTEIFQNKSIPVGDGTFVCIPLECSVIDCTQYQDCSPS